MSHCYQRESPVGLKGEGRAGLHQPGPGSRLAMEAGAPGLVSQGRTRPQRACAAGGGRRERTSISGHNPLPSYANDSTQELSFQNLGDTTMKSSGTEGGCARSRSRRADGRTDRQPGRSPPSIPPPSDTHTAGSGQQRPEAPEEGPTPFPPRPAPDAGVPTPPRGTYTSVLLREEIWAVVRAFLLGGEAAAARAGGTEGHGGRQGG